MIAKVPPSNPNKSGAAGWIPKLGRRVPHRAVDIPPYEYLARGWDATNEKWQEVLWTALDQDFRAAEREGTSPVWKMQWNGPEEAETNAGLGIRRAEEANGPAQPAKTMTGKGNGPAQGPKTPSRKGKEKEKVIAG